MPNNQKVVEMARAVASRYHNSTIYIAVVVTLILILQIVDLSKHL